MHALLRPSSALLASCLFSALCARAEPLSLEEAHSIALRNHPRIAIARLQELISREQLKDSRSAYLPTANGFIDGVRDANSNTRILAGGLSNPSIYDRLADGVAISEVLTDFGQTRNLVASSVAITKAQGANTEATEQQLLLAVDLNYYAALQAQAVVKVAEQTLAARQLLVDQVSALEANHLRSQLDVSFAQVALEQSRLLLQKSREDLDSAQASLAAALGYPEAHAFDLVDSAEGPSAPPPVSDIVQTALARRPDLVKMRYEQESAERLARAQKAKNYPVIEAVGTAGNAMSHDARIPNRYAVGGILVDIPLFAGGQTLARQHEAELRAQIAAQSVRDLEERVARDVRLAWLHFNTGLERFRTTEQLFTHASEAFALSQARYQQGSSSIVELSEAQINMTSAQIARTNARYDELIERAILDFQAGILR